MSKSDVWQKTKSKEVVQINCVQNCDECMTILRCMSNFPLIFESRSYSFIHENKNHDTSLQTSIAIIHSEN